MAQKKITDLTLRADVTAECNFPTDDTIQTYRVTAEQIKDFVMSDGNVITPALSETLFHGLSAVAPAQDDYVPIVDTSDSNKNKKVLLNLVKNRAVRSVVSTDTCTSADDVLLLSGASFNQTIFTAVGNRGKVIRVQHNGTNLTEVYTLLTTSGQTISGYASGAIALYTNGEWFDLMSDDSNWVIIGHQARTPLIDAGAISIAATGTALAKGTTLKDKMFWSRDGQFAECRFEYEQNGVGTAGTGAYLITLPASLAFDTTYVLVNTSTNNSACNGPNLGFISGSVATAENCRAGVVAWDATRFRVVGVGGGSDVGYWGAGFLQLSNSQVRMGGYFRFPVAGWLP